jgi:hypothetical protein
MPSKRSVTIPLISASEWSLWTLVAAARHTKAPMPVIALPTIRFCIWYVPS